MVYDEVGVLLLGFSRSAEVAGLGTGVGDLIGLDLLGYLLACSGGLEVVELGGYGSYEMTSFLELGVVNVGELGAVVLDDADCGGEVAEG